LILTPDCHSEGFELDRGSDVCRFFCSQTETCYTTTWHYTTEDCDLNTVLGCREDYHFII